MPGLPRSRLMVNDLIHLSRAVPLFLIEKEFDLAALADLRLRVQPRISWTILFVKAYALVAAQSPPLRQAYCRWPWPRLYQYPISTVSIAVQRTERLFWARIADPAILTLTGMQTLLERFKTGAVQEVFRTQLRTSRFPGPLRRLIWRLAHDFSGKIRAKEFGTFGISTLAGQGVYNRIYPSFLATNLTLGPLNDQGRTTVGLLYDHRVMDGIVVAQALNDLEKVLQTKVFDELAGMSSLSACA